MGGLATTEGRQWIFINPSSDGHFVTVPQPGNSRVQGRWRNTQESTSLWVMSLMQNTISQIIMVTVGEIQGPCIIKILYICVRISKSLLFFQLFQSGYTRILSFLVTARKTERRTHNLNPTARDWEKATVGSWEYQITLLSVTLMYGSALGIISILCTDVALHLF